MQPNMSNQMNDQPEAQIFALPVPPNTSGMSGDGIISLTYLLKIFIRATILALLVYSLVITFIVSTPKPVLFVNSLLLIFQILCYYLLHRGAVDLVAKGIVIAYWFYVTIQIYVLVGFSGAMVVGYPLVVLAAGALISRRAAMWATLASLVIGWVLIYLDQTFPPPPTRVTINPFFDLLIYMLAVPLATVLWQLAYLRISQAVRVALAHASALAEKNLELEHEIEERRQAETALLVRKAQLQTIVANAPILVWSIDAAMKLTLVEGRQLRRLGVRPEEILGQPITDVFATLFPEIVAQLPHVIAGESIVTVDTADGLIIETHFALLKDESDQIQAVIGIGVDIAERKQAEEMMQQAQRLDSLGLLAGGVAHDFNNLLVAMLGQSSLALTRLSPAEPAYKAIEKVMQAAKRAADLTRQLLAYSGRGQFEIKPLSLNLLITENMHLFRVAVSGQIELRTDLAPDLQSIEADAGQIQQVAMNLILNAVQAIGDNPGVVIVKTRNQRVTKTHSRYWQYTGYPLQTGDYVALEVHDTGCGMDKATLSQLFEPFYSTRTDGRGLGLAAVLGIIRGHKGGIHVSSKVGQGTCFCLLFPTSQFPAELAPTAVAAPVFSRPVGRVLIIDDEPHVRKTVADILALEGIPCLVAEHGAEGLALLAQYHEEISLILLDLMMPGMSGEEVFQQIRQFDPEMKIILTSGYHEQEAMRRFAGSHVSSFLQKPYNVQKLLETIHQGLSGITTKQ